MSTFITPSLTASTASDAGLARVHRAARLLGATLAASAGLWTGQPAAALTAPGHGHPASAPVWLGEYFNNTDLSGQPAMRRPTRNVWFNWGSASPGRVIRRDNWSARFTRPVSVPAGDYQFRIRTDDGVRMWVDNTLVIDAWGVTSARESIGGAHLNGDHLLRVEYFERTGDALLKLSILRLPGSPVAPDWRAEFFNNEQLIGNPALVRNDRELSFDFGTISPAPGVTGDHFSARWTRTVNYAPGYYNVSALADDGVRVYAGARLLLDEWREGAPRTVSARVFLSGETPLRVEYFDRTGGARIQVSVTPVGTAAVATAVPQYSDWRAEFFGNLNLGGPAVATRNDVAINFDWAQGAPDPRVPADNFSARWTRRQYFAAGVYRIDATFDDGMRMYIDNTMVLDEWVDGAMRARGTSVSLPAGDHELRVEYYERAGGANIKVGIAPEVAVIAPTAAP